MSDQSPRRSDVARLKDKAMRILAGRDHSALELRRKLAAPAWKPDPEATPVSAEDIETVVAWCAENNWLDDGRFAERFIAGRSRKGYGPQRIRQELQQKGISREMAEHAMMECDIDWAAQAREIALRKFGDPLPTTFPEKVKVQRYIMTRGFFMEDAQAIYQNFND